MPRVSVCIPSYNLGPFIGKTIESVLAQTFTDFELLIEDDGSTDNSLEIIRAASHADSRIRYTSRDFNIGANGTTNNLLRLAVGEYVALLAADDMLHPEKLAKQVAYLDANPSCGAVFTHPIFIDEAGAEIDRSGDAPNKTRKEWLDAFRRGNCLFISSSLIRNQFGEVNEAYPLLADLEYYVRIAKVHDLHVIQEHLTYVRKRDNNANLSAPTLKNVEQHCDELDAMREQHFPVDMKKKKILFMTPFYENKGYSPYIRSMFQTVYMLGRHTTMDFDFQEVSGGSYVHHARNLMADLFLKSDCTHLFFIDSDQSWDIQGLLNVLKSDKEVVGAAYPVKNNWENYGVTIYCDEKTNVAIVDPKDGLIKAEKVPTGFMKISRTVFEKIKKANPTDWYWDNERKLYNYFGHLTVDHVMYGEDISFGIRWRRTGGETWVEPRVEMGHYGVQGWYGNYDRFLRKQPGGDLAPSTTEKAA